MTSILHAVLPRPFVLALMAALLALASMVPNAAYAATITVTNTNDSDPGSLRQAIADAAPGDTIDLTGLSGTITLTSGQLVINKDLTIIGPGAATLAIDGNASSLIFVVNPGVTASISGLTITNGNASMGGGIYNLGTLTLTNSAISGNTVVNGGGGIYNAGSSATLTLTNSAVSGNSAVGRFGVGGGIFNAGSSATLTLTNSIITGNTAVNIGGGIYNAGSSATLTLTNSTVSGNTSVSDGGGIANARGTVELANSTVSGNTAAGGGGIYNAGSSATLTLTNSTVSGNTAGSSGGGIVNNLGTLTLTNSTVSGNTATNGLGGGIFNRGTLTLSNSTVNGNRAAGGGGIYNSGGTTNLKNTIVAGNTAGFIGPDCSGTLTSQGYNLIQDTSGCTITGDLTGNITGQVPLLGPLQDNGGPTETHELLDGSPAINAGNPATPGSGGNACEATDQRGVARPVGPRCDIGAFEGEVVTNEAPVCNDDSFSMNEDTVVSRTPPCSDPDSDTIEIEIVALNLVSVSPVTVTIPNGTQAWDVQTTLPNANGTGFSYTYKATDPSGAESNVATATITVNPVNDPPTVSVDSPSVTVDEGQTANNTGSYSDIDTGDNVSITASVGTVTKTGTNRGTWSWSKPAPDGPDSYTVTITAEDDDGRSSTTSFSVTVNNVDPTVDAGPDAENFSGDTHHVSATFSDPGANDVPWSWIIDWGDGDSDSGSTSDQSVAITGNHVYFVPGDYTVEVCVTDKDGGTGCDSHVKTVKAVQVIINNKPGSDPNSVSLNMKHVPVAILTTTAGEYGTPRDFDATKVDASQTVWGTRANWLAIQSGGTEVHGKVHFEDSRELDETTKDGDIDAVLHFSMEGSGVDPDTTETCVWGVTTDGVYFTGCDALRVVQSQDGPNPGKGKK